MIHARDLLAAPAPAKSAKYRNVKIVTGGVAFDSKAEAGRWQDLLLLEKAGAIDGLKRQVPFLLALGVRLYGEKRARPPIRYVADFTYRVNGDLIVEDTKGRDTPMSRLKRHLMKAVLGLDVRLTT